ncbi:hypothetical protein Tco_0998905, partial [Tanacetum coccineum]
KEMDMNITQLCNLDPMLDDIKILARCISIWKSHPLGKPNEVGSAKLYAINRVDMDFNNTVVKSTICVKALIEMKLEKHKNLREESGYYWREIQDGTLKFLQERIRGLICTSQEGRDSSGVDVYTALAAPVGALCGLLNDEANEAKHSIFQFNFRYHTAASFGNGPPED